MTRKTLNIAAKSLGWLGDTLVDWVRGGRVYLLDGTIRESGVRYAYRFDSAKVSPTGEYAVLYEKLGTKGLLLKKGSVLREINRSFYQANVYEYPVEFFVRDGNTYLVHAPLEYCRLDFEEVETGKLVTDIPNRKPIDVFHSRLEVSPNAVYLMSRGWVWHPLDVITLFDINACFEDPHKLDANDLTPNFGAEISSASFIDDRTAIVGAAAGSLEFESGDAVPPKHIARWNLSAKTLLPAQRIEDTFGSEFGNLIAINDTYAWDLYKHLKLINLKTGIVETYYDDIPTGLQLSSIIHHVGDIPAVAYNRTTQTLAIGLQDRIEVLSL
jgi:hypothetical protein